jgi:hypothetical protein
MCTPISQVFVSLSVCMLNMLELNNHQSYVITANTFIIKTVIKVLWNMRSTKFNRAKQRLLMKKCSTAESSCTT